MFIFKKHISRRTAIKGAGVTLALPFLDAMVPAFARAEITKPPVRMAFMYVPNGIMMDQWFPKLAGTSAPLPSTPRPSRVVVGSTGACPSGASVHAVPAGRSALRTDVATSRDNDKK